MRSCTLYTVYGKKSKDGTGGKGREGRKDKKRRLGWVDVMIWRFGRDAGWE